MPDLNTEALEGFRPGGSDPELIIGLVGAVGAGLDPAKRYLRDALHRRNYSVESFSLSDQIEEFSDIIEEIELVDSPENERIRSFQKGGNELRKKLDRNDAIALLSCLDIRNYRETNDSRATPVPRQAYILDSLKNPKEVETLRSIYGDGFILIAVYAPEQERQERLAREISGDRTYEVGQNEEIDRMAFEIIEIDRHEEGKDFGQNVRDTFPKADIFLDATSHDELDKDVKRCVDLLFGAPFDTPTRDEQCMYMAEAARSRSSALGRQVGAALSKPHGEIISIGCNDAPRGGGGLYWPDHKNDNRDFQIGENLSGKKRIETLHEVIQNLNEMGALRLDELDIEAEDLAELDVNQMKKLMDRLEDTRLSSLIEFYRATHAEMDAILAASRKGISVEDAILYSTTFPCHECTRHVIAAGIDRVVYVEPYPKSLGPELHGDAVNVDGQSPSLEVWERKEAKEAPKVNFEPFVGVGPRIYDQVFQSGKRKEDGEIVDWPPENPDPIFGITHSGWLIDEVIELDELENQLGPIS